MKWKSMKWYGSDPIGVGRCTELRQILCLTRVTIAGPLGHLCLAHLVSGSDPAQNRMTTSKPGLAPTKDKLEDMDVSLEKVAARSGPKL